MDHPVEAYDWGEKVNDPNYGYRQNLRLENGWTIIRRYIAQSPEPRQWLVSVCDATYQTKDPFKFLVGPQYGQRSHDDKRFLDVDELLALVQAVTSSE